MCVSRILYLVVPDSSSSENGVHLVFLFWRSSWGILVTRVLCRCPVSDQILWEPPGWPLNLVRINGKRKGYSLSSFLHLFYFSSKERSGSLSHLYDRIQDRRHSSQCLCPILLSYRGEMTKWYLTSTLEEPKTRVLKGCGCLFILERKVSLSLIPVRLSSSNESL